MNIKKNITKMVLLSSLFFGGNSLKGSEEQLGTVMQLSHDVLTQASGHLQIKFLEDYEPGPDEALPNIIFIYTRSKKVFVAHQPEIGQNMLTEYIFPLSKYTPGVVKKDYALLEIQRDEDQAFHFVVNNQIPESSITNRNSPYYSPLIDQNGNLSNSSRAYCYSSSGTFSPEFIRNIWHGINLSHKDENIWQKVIQWGLGKWYGASDEDDTQAMLASSYVYLQQKISDPNIKPKETDKIQAQLAFIEGQLGALPAADSELEPLEYSCDVFVDDMYLGRVINGNLAELSVNKLSDSMEQFVNELTKTPGDFENFTSFTSWLSTSRHPIWAALAICCVITGCVTGDFYDLAIAIHNLSTCSGEEFQIAITKLVLRAAYALFPSSISGLF